jgi:chromosome segregation protein
VHLRAITLSGFKTFARRTEIRFDGGMVAIVGPNGSGKSNIVDAFKWVLGETQARDLRGRTMDEVIYAGGERAAKASQAEVALVLDNRDRRLPVDYEEVELKRRVERGGSSDYYLNGSRVRRRDLMHLLASTGLTTDSYSIVNQGDIEAIVTASPEQRRQLLEEAAQVRGVKQQRSEAAARMSDLAQNLLRLEDLRQELRPRLEGLGLRAEAAREAAAAQARLEVLKGSIVWEEWRETRDAHRRASTQKHSLERRLEEARAQAEEAEAAFQTGRTEMEAAQDRRLARQRVLGTLRLELSTAEHSLAMARERLANLGQTAAALSGELQELAGRARTAAALHAQLSKERVAAEAAFASVPADPPIAPVAVPGDARQAAQLAERARREAIQAASALASIRTRRQFLEETVARLEAQVLPAERDLPETEHRSRETTESAARATGAAAEIVRLRAELEGLEALWPAPGPGQFRVGDVLQPEPGYEAALSGVLGHLVDAWVAPDELAAARSTEAAESQLTVVVAGSAPEPLPGSLAGHVAARPGFEWLSRRLLGGVRIDHPEPPTVTLDGVFRDGLVYRGGPDRRVSLAARRRALEERIGSLEEPAAAAPGLEAEARVADADAAALRSAAAGRSRLEEALAQIDGARRAEAEAATSLPTVEAAADSAAAAAEEMRRSVAEEERAQAGLAAERRRLEVERERWRERVGDLSRQLQAVDSDLDAIESGRLSRAARLEEAEAAQAGAGESIAGLEEQVTVAEARLQAAEEESPGGEAELAGVARRLVALEEARVDARLRSRTLEGNLELISRETELLEARLEEIRGRMPMGQAPEEVPGGKAREREMRQLERRLEEIGPVNPLAESEFAELTSRCSTLEEQLADIESARLDLETLVNRLREEEDSRYEAVFGAVAVNFQEYFAELSAGGKATLSHVAGDDGPRSGVEVLVQPPRKRLQNITLLSSGERSLTALALVLALEEVNPSPFMILDEVDAALDDANVSRYGDLLQRLGRHRQLLVITHNHVTMANANTLYGIHLDESGRSSLVSVSLEDVRQPAGARAATA